MISPDSLLRVAHVVGLALGIGAATSKVVLLLQSGTDPGRLSVYLQVARRISRLIVVGMILVTLSGIGWLLSGYPVMPRLIVKLVLVAAIWVMGPVIDNVVEPQFGALAPAHGAQASPEFLRVRRRYLTLETVATLLFYAIVVLWAWD